MLGLSHVKLVSGRVDPLVPLELVASNFYGPTFLQIVLKFPVVDVSKVPINTRKGLGALLDGHSNGNIQ